MHTRDALSHRIPYLPHLTSTYGTGTYLVVLVRGTYLVVLVALVSVVLEAVVAAALSAEELLGEEDRGAVRQTEHARAADTCNHHPNNSLVSCTAASTTHTTMSHKKKLLHVHVGKFNQER